MAGAEARWVWTPGLWGWHLWTSTGSNSLRGGEWGREDLMLPVTKGLSANDDSLGQWIKVLWIFHNTSLQVREEVRRREESFGERWTEDQKGQLWSIPKHTNTWAVSKVKWSQVSGTFRQWSDYNLSILCSTEHRQTILLLLCNAGWMGCPVF